MYKNSYLYERKETKKQLPNFEKLVSRKEDFSP